MSDISQVIYHAVNIMSKCFGCIKIEIIDTKMTSNGVRISIYSGVKKHIVYLKHSMAEDICIYGESLANDIIYQVIMEDAMLLERKLKLDKINKL